MFNYFFKKTKTYSNLIKTNNHLNESIDLLSNQVLELIDRFDALEQTNQKLTEQVTHYKNLETKHNSDEPWIEIIGEDTDEQGNIQIRMDWNEAFIESLRNQGFAGNSNDMVARWLNQLKTIMNNSQ